MTRIWLIFSFFLLCFAFIYLRLGYLQIVKGTDYKQQALRQHYFEMIIPPKRGDIESEDHTKLVLNQPSWLIYAEPRRIENKTDFADKISKILEIPKDELYNSLTNQSKYWVPLGYKVPPNKKDEIESLKLTGIGYEKDPSRFYPEASMAAHLLGFVGKDEFGKDQGYFGVEGYYDKYLRGKDGKLLQERDARGIPILIGNSQRIEAQDGRSLVLWVDKTIQYIAEKSLAEGIARYGAKEGTVIVMDPFTGGILANANYPSYDPAEYYKYTQDSFKNPAVTSSYEPGSTFKVIVMSAGIEDNAVKPMTQINEDGPVKIGQYTIRTWDNKYHGLVTMTDVLIHSSNVGMVYVGQKLGIKRLLFYLHAFGFTEPTEIDVQDEETFNIRPDEDWKDIDLATASFGQGIAVTPMQMIRAVSVIANGGWLMKPMVVKSITEPGGKNITIQPERIRHVLSSQTAQLVSEMMVATVDQGEAKWAKPKGYRIAGKTGTAQIPVAGHYDAQKTIASFVGFAPADNPKFVILVTLREPASSPWGSETAAPLFFSISKELFTYYSIVPD